MGAKSYIKLIQLSCQDVVSLSEIPYFFYLIICHGLNSHPSTERINTQNFNLHFYLPFDQHFDTLH